MEDFELDTKENIIKALVIFYKQGIVDFTDSVLVALNELNTSVDGKYKFTIKELIDLVEKSKHICLEQTNEAITDIQ